MMALTQQRDNEREQRGERGRKRRGGREEKRTSRAEHAVCWGRTQGGV